MTTPAWRRKTSGEHRWPVTIAVVVTIGLQIALPDKMVPQSRYLLPALELVLLLGLVVANPYRLDRESAVLRACGLAMTGLIALSNAWSAVLLVIALVTGKPSGPSELLTAGATIWLTNVLSFSLIYWELDRGGPAARAAAVRDAPDFLFVQMQSPELAAKDWEPAYVDYLYLSFTNSTAFSPTDVMPLSRWAKLAMMVQSAVSLVVVALVVARAVNVLG
ncbi:DUF1345 domain-containing protein [Pseudonocardia spinosispora]|uniref:DUF1345 domain-containing protein n=1 Tax=Pseudonocardia spinosispora TaxID=103441 RepID=UPI00041084CA|nr:DUF1345 domain-containing protein [Pseudonocardia spinosispora]